MGISFAQTTQLLTRALDGIWARQQAAAQNIANADTPGYKRATVDFESALRTEISRLSGGQTLAMPIVVGTVTNPRHIPFSSAQAALATGADPASSIAQGVESATSLRNDQNNVDIDQEMTQLAEASLRYQALSDAVAKRFSMLKSVLH